MAGTYTNGLPTVPNSTTGTSYSSPIGSELIAADTVIANGQAPQSVALTTAQIALLGALAVVNTATMSGTGATSTVTLSKQSGTLTSDAVTTASGATHTMTLTNTMITATSIVNVAALNLAATTGRMKVTSITPAAGSCTVVFTNYATAAINGTFAAAFIVI